MPTALKMIDELPGLFHFVAARKERRVPRHRIQQEPFVSFRTALSKTGRVVEVHLDRLHPQTSARQFGDDPQGNPLVGLNADDEHIAPGHTPRQCTEEHPGGIFEVHRNLGRLLRKPLAHPDIKWNPAPSPGIDHHAQGDVRFGHRFRIHPILLAIAHHRLPVHMPGGILGPHRIRGHQLGGLPLPQRSQHLGRHDGANGGAGYPGAVSTSVPSKSNRIVNF